MLSARIRQSAPDLGDRRSRIETLPPPPRAARDRAPTSGCASRVVRRPWTAADRTARAVGERYPPVAPRKTRFRDRVGQRRVVRLQRLHGVRPDIEPGAGFGMIVARHPLQAGHFDALEPRQSRAITQPATPAPTMTMRIRRSVSCGRSPRSVRRRPAPDARRRRTRRSGRRRSRRRRGRATAPRIWRWALMSVSSSMVWRFASNSAAPVRLAFDQHGLRSARRQPPRPAGWLRCRDRPARRPCAPISSASAIGRCAMREGPGPMRAVAEHDHLVASRPRRPRKCWRARD